MKVHIGVDSQTGVVHSMTTTSANVHDLTELPRLLHGGESQVWGDAGYQGVDKRPGNRGLDVEWQVAMRPGQRRKLEPESPEAVSEKRKASVRAKVEHPFLYIKRQETSATPRSASRGLSKNTQRLMTLLGFANLMRAEQSPGGVKPCISAPKINLTGETPCGCRPRLTPTTCHKAIQRPLSQSGGRRALTAPCVVRHALNKSRWFAG